jgi:hypothetical protein
MPSTISRSFAGGELATALFARADQTKYQTGLRTCRNFIVQRFGGVTNRPGTQWICETKSSGQVRLLKFVFNASQTYVLEFGDLYMRVIKSGVLLGAPYEIVTPYVAADLRDLQFVQSADVVTIVHPSYQPRELRRLADTSWTLTTLVTAPSTTTPTGVANSGAVGTTTQWVVTAAASEAYAESLPSTATGSSAVPSSGTPITVSWSTVAGASEYYIYKNVNGVYGYIGTAVGTSFKDDGIKADTTDTPPQERTLFTATGDYPQAVNYFQQRLCFASADNAPEKVWMSRTGNYRDFSHRSPLQDDDAVTFTIVGKQVNEVRHLLELDRLILLTAGAEWIVQGNQDGSITPTTINLRQIGYNGSSSLAPVVIGNSALFVQARGSIVRDLRYEVQVDSYQGRDLTVYSPHLFDGFQVVAWDYAQIPHSVVWAVRDDGTLLGLTYLREHEVWGWHRHDTGDGDAYEDVCVVPEGNEDAVYVVVRRTISGATKRYIERFASRQIKSVSADAKFVDAHLSYDGTNYAATTMALTGGTAWAYTETLTLTASASFFTAGDVGNAIVLTSGSDTVTLTILGYTSGTVVSVQSNKTVPASLRSTALATWSRAADVMTGLGHLEGRTVSILADGNVHPQRAVTGGQVTLDRPYSVVHVGLPITSDIETLPLETIQSETLTDKRKRVNRVTLLLEASRGGFVGPDSTSTMKLREVKQRTGYSTGGPVPLVTGQEEVNIGTDWSQTGGVFVRQSDPLPMTILAIVPSGIVAQQ